MTTSPNVPASMSDGQRDGIDPYLFDRAHKVARAWLHAYGIDTERYTRNGGEHPAMYSLPHHIEKVLFEVRTEAEAKARAEMAVTDDMVAAAMGAYQESCWDRPELAMRAAIEAAIRQAAQTKVTP